MLNPVEYPSQEMSLIQSEMHATSDEIAILRSIESDEMVSEEGGGSRCDGGS